jgi:sugar lactone lactonase YvrE
MAASGSPMPNVTLSANSGNSLDGPAGLALDSSGNLWVANDFGSTIVEFTPSQLATTASPTPNVTLLSTASLSGPFGMAFDSSGDLWVANFNSDALLEFTPSQLATAFPTPNVTLDANSNNSLDEPTGLAFDSLGDLWVANQGSNTVVEFTPAELDTSGSPTPNVTLSANPADSLDHPDALAFDSSGQLWVANSNSNTVVEFNLAALAISGSPTPNVTLSPNAGNSLDTPSGLAFDSSGNLWVANFDGNTVVEFTPATLATSGSPTPNVTLSPNAGNSLDAPSGLAFDPAGDLWVVNSSNSSVVDFTPSQLSTGSPTPAATISGVDTGLSSPNGIATVAAPAVPGAVSALAGDAQVSVSWGPVTGAGSYQVFDATTAGAEDYSGAPACTTTGTSCSVGSLADGTTYYFTVEALGPGGTSPPSDEVTATPEVPTTTTTTTMSTSTTSTSTTSITSTTLASTSTMPTTTAPATTSTSTTTTTVPPPPPGTTTTSGPPPGPPPATIATTTLLMSSANPGVVGAAVTYRARVSLVPNGGSVSFSDDGSTPSGCGSVVVSAGTGEATCTVTYDGAGQHTITASYSGNAIYGPSSSAPFSQVVVLGLFPRADVTYPNGAVVDFSGVDYVFAGGRAFRASSRALQRLRRADPGVTVSAPAGARAPTGTTPRPGTLLSTEGVNGTATVYVVGTDGDLYGLASRAQLRASGFDGATVVSVPDLGGLTISRQSAHAAGITALTTRADGAIVDSGGAYYVFAGGKPFGFQSPGALTVVRRADRAEVLSGTVTTAERSTPIADGVVVGVAGSHGGVYVTYGGDAYPLRSPGQLADDGYGGTAVIPVPNTGHLKVVYRYAGS